MGAAASIETLNSAQREEYEKVKDHMSESEIRAHLMQERFTNKSVATAPPPGLLPKSTSDISIEARAATAEEMGFIEAALKDKATDGG